MTISCNVRKRRGGHRCPLPAIHGAGQQAADGRLAYPGSGRYLAIGQSLRPERQEEPIARRQLPQGIARRPQPAILVAQRRGLHGGLVRRGPRQPPEAASQAVAAGIRRHGEQPAAEVARCARRPRDAPGASRTSPAPRPRHRRDAAPGAARTDRSRVRARGTSRLPPVRGSSGFAIRVARGITRGLPVCDPRGKPGLETQGGQRLTRLFGGRASVLTAWIVA